MSDRPAGEKLQKILARQGLGSRRSLEQSISEGRVKVNGQVAKLGDRASDSDRIEFDGKVVRLEQAPTRVILYNKPEGQVCSRSDEKGRQTVFSSLPRLTNQRWINVGRLDINTSGLLLFTTDGELANKLMHPSSNIDREYMVRIYGDVSDDQVNQLLAGVELDDGMARFTDIVESENDDGVNRWFTVCLMEGRNREVRRLWESQGAQVNRLKRVRYGPIFMPSYVRSGQWVDLTEQEIKTLYRTCDMKTPSLSVKSIDEQKRIKRQELRLRAKNKASIKSKIYRS